MGLYWTYKSLPEFRNVSPTLRGQVWRRCLNRAPAKRWHSPALVGAVFAVGLSRELAFRWVGLSRDFLPASAFTLVGALTYLMLWKQVMLHQARVFIPEEMPGHCTGCGYNLCGLEANCCPECGTAIVKPATADESTGNPKIS
jgi:hypothetical protein